MELLKSVAIHNGPFHADEVTACALLITFDLIDRDKIFRTRDTQKIIACEYVCDVGGIYDPETKHFDHHQADYKGQLSSAGMILLYLKEEGIIPETLFNWINDHLVLGIDLHDNGLVTTERGHCSFSGVIHYFNPAEHDADTNESFNQALDFVLGHLKRLIDRYNYIQDCNEIVKEAMDASDGKIMEFDRSISWVDSFFQLGGEKHTAEFLIMPSGNHWKLRGVPPSYDERMKVRRPFPQKWAGLMNSDLKKASGIQGAIFCHKGRFISVWETKEDALLAYKMVLEEE
ncbi:MAG: hypothetical protein SP1CHLAM54_04350 [Chlamydiia bacterium]|nr:hypothetical protein [Chlamydiia bacterium]MCH9615349.1 hypothetical protein [Chlamydiia bacterium]MCH9628329.1 hypothetical protein [Chlamydiia bacterium]